MAKKNYDDLVKQIASNIGGAENVNSVFHCATRLRFKVKDTNKVDKKRLEQKLEDLQKMYATDNIEYFTNYLDTSIFIVNDEIRALYKKYLKEEIKAENELIGFVNLDLD